MKMPDKITHTADDECIKTIGLLYDEIMQRNIDAGEDFHSRLNIFLSKMLFCFFAEDTNLFEHKHCFSDGINQCVKTSEEDLQTYLTQVFRMLNTQDGIAAAGYPKLPFVEGGLFQEDIELPKLSKTAGDLILKFVEMNWSEINLDVFGCTVQGTATSEERSKLGQHYTDEFNILKCLNPLFLNKLNMEFRDSTQIKDVAKQEKILNSLLAKIRDIIIFDPASGSGNFLIVAYEHLRRLENSIFQALQGVAIQKYLPYSGIPLSNFYGIEINELPVKLAQLSLWIKQAQMDVETKDLFNVCNKYLPFRSSGNVICGNSLQLDWQKICPIPPGKIVYIAGNPPFKGESKQSKEQKNDMRLVFNNTGMDYVCCWFKKAADYIQNDPRLEFAFVSTNSISQGQSIHRFWPRVLENTGLEIHVGYLSFKWRNKAKKNAGVTCNIIGMRHKSAEPKYIYDKNASYRKVEYVAPSLADYKAPQGMKRQKPISNIPEIMQGAGFSEGGNLIIDDFYQKEQIIRECPEAEKFIRKYMNGEDLLYRKLRYCLWIADQDLTETRSINWINERLNKVSEFRRNASGVSIAKFVDKPNKPTSLKGGVATHNTMIFPIVSSRRRSYLPCDFIHSGMTVVTNSCFTMHNAPFHMLAIISSRMHMIWLQEFCRRRGESLGYSSTMVYNTFPLPDLDKKENLLVKECLEAISGEIISLRKEYYKRGETLASLYGDKMPGDLLKLHLQGDQAIESLYRDEPFSNDQERLNIMIKLHNYMVDEERKREIQPLSDIKFSIGRQVDYISPSLADYRTPKGMKKRKPISNIPEIRHGISFKEGGNLIIDGFDKKEQIIRECPKAEKFIKKYIGGEDLLYRKLRYCLLIADQDLAEARSINWINERLNKVSEFRRNASGVSIAKVVDQPNKPTAFGGGVATHNSMIFPGTSSHRRSYLPCDFVESDVAIVGSKCFIMHDAPIHMLAIISSRMHMIWLQEFCGRLKEDLSYSSMMVYNTFPLPDLDKKENLFVKECLGAISREIISLRKGYYERGETLASLYGNKMPEDLLSLHLKVDRMIESLYKDGTFLDDDERLKTMIKLYRRMTEE